MEDHQDQQASLYAIYMYEGKWLPILMRELFFALLLDGETAMVADYATTKLLR